MGLRGQVSLSQPQPRHYPHARMQLVVSNCDAKALEEYCEILWGRSVEGRGLPGPGVREAQCSRMQHRPRRLDHPGPMVAVVDLLTEQRVALLREMDPDLVLAPGLQAAFDQRCAPERFE